jgi:Ca2+-binding RTX toxin-like protein
MTTHHITGHKTATYNLQSSGDTFILDKKASIAFDGDYAIYQDSMGHDNRLVIEGSATGGDAFLNAGIYLGGPNSDVRIASTGVVRGNAAVELDGTKDNLRNDGRLLGDGYGILADKNNHIDNFGVIKGAFAISTHGSDVTVINRSGGKIIGEADAMVMAGDLSTHHTIINHGLMKGGDDALYGYDSNSTITNRGVMKGMILLGGGDDSFDNRGGSIDHDVEGQAGNDTLIADQASAHLVELSGEGTDTVKSTVSYKLSANVEVLTLLGTGNINGTGNAEANEIHGNKGDNKLAGLAGADTLNGAGGDDIMTGGADADIFLFSKGGGHDIIKDFKHGEDHVDLSGQDTIADFDDMIANHTTSSHGDLTIHVGNATLTLENTSAGGLDFKDFFF